MAPMDSPATVYFAKIRRTTSASAAMISKRAGASSVFLT